MLKRLLFAPLFASALVAQTAYFGEAPTTLIPAATFPPLGPGAIGNNVTSNYQCRLVQSFLLPPNTYYACLSVGSSSPSATYRLMSGTFNEVTGVFTKNTDADGLNTGFGTSELFALSVTNDLLTAAFDTAAGIRWATRPNITSAFTLQPTIVSGITGTYRDPNFGFVDGKDVLFHINGTSIAFGDWSAGVVTNIRTVALLLGSGALHSPMPVNDVTGTTRALTYCDTTVPVSGLTYKLMFASSLIQDPSVPPYKYYDNAAWLENGNATGGTITIISATSNYMDPYRLGIAAVNSATYAANTPGTAVITSFAPQQSPTATPYAGATLLGNLGSSGLALVPSIVGKLSLDVQGPIIALPSGTFANNSGTFQQTVGYGSLPAGAKVWMQSVVFDIPASTIYLSNTGKVEWK